VLQGVIDAVNELLDELATSASSISERVNDMVPFEDTILTVGSSATVLHFLLAAKVRCYTPPSCHFNLA
jgi:translation initiation factor 2B subunit (eIF-2B alpha/beta/delta family)